MPDPTEYEDEEKWMAACVPKMLDEGKEQEQAVAACLSMWREKKAVAVKAGRVLAQRNANRIVQAVQALREALDDAGISLEPDEENEDEEKSLTDVSVYFGEAVKSLGDGRVGGYLVRYSTEQDPDISGIRDFFTKDTDFLTEFPRTSPAWFNHAMDPKKRRLSHDASLTQDDFGVWAETILDERDRYEKFLLDLANQGKLGWSSGTASHLVEREPVGNAHRVKSWPLGLDASLTHIPAEPRNSVIPLKSLSVLLPPIPETPQADAQADDMAHRDEPAAEATQPTILEPLEGKAMGEITITEEKLQELIGAAADAGAEKALKSMPAIQPAANIEVVKDEADQEFEKPGDFFKAVKTAALYPGREDPRLKSLKATGLSEGVPADGGYLIPQAMSTGIMSRMLDTGKILGRCANDAVSGNNMTYNGVDETTHSGSLYGGLVGYWLNEGGTKTATKPKFYQVELKLKKIAALCYATDEQLEDTAALSSWLTRTVPDVLAWYVESAIVSGDGVGKPLGITNSPCLVSQVRLDANEINPEDFAYMWSRRWTGVNDYVWLINPSVSAWLPTLTVGNFPVMLPAYSLNNQPIPTIFGAPVIETEHCAAVKSAGDVLLCSLSQYQTITKGGVQTATSIHVAFTTDETAFRFVYRIDGAPLWHSTMTPANGSTYSPFVSLAAAST